MATQLPTISVTDGQAAVLLALFGDVPTYKAWLKQAVIDEARRRKSAQLHETANVTVRDGLAVFDGTIPAPDVVVP